jgi:hypothetical protein
VTDDEGKQMQDSQGNLQIKRLQYIELDRRCGRYLATEYNEVRRRYLVQILHLEGRRSDEHSELCY